MECKNRPTKKKEMNIQCQMPKGIHSICAVPLSILMKMEIVKTIVSKLSEELAFLMGI